MKFKTHPSITDITIFNKGTRSDFCSVNAQEVVKEIKKRSTRRATQSTDSLLKY